MVINGYDFLDWLIPDMSARVFQCIDDPADIIRAGAVSRSWRNFVTSNSLMKEMCIRICPEVSHFVSNSQSSERNHNIYAYLNQSLVSKNDTRTSCISKCIGASSTDRYPDERIEHTLQSEDSLFGHLCYWSSKGEISDDMFETLTYHLDCDICIVDEIKIRPWLALAHPGSPIYFANFVRFKMGRSKFTIEPEYNRYNQNRDFLTNDDDYSWIYTSPKFPMQKDNILQSFKLPRPVLCLGGVVQIELIRSAQRCPIDNLHYICVSHVQVLGRPISRLALLLRCFRSFR